MQHVKATTEKTFPNLFFINFIPAAAPTIYVIIPNEFGINTMFSILI
ncbi:hypothetical protein AAHH72_15070 [Bacillus cereus]